MNNQSIAGKLLFSQNAISNAKNVASIKEALAIFGYDDTKINEGASLLSTAEQLQNKQLKEYGEQFAATDELNLAKATANKQYMVHLKLARIVFKQNREAQESLILTGDRKTSISGWLKQAKTFYSNAIGNLKFVESLQRFGVTAEKLQEAQSQVLAVESKLAAQLTEKGEAQQATVNRDQALDELQEWMGEFKTIARIALESDSQLLEVLGIVEES